MFTHVNVHKHSRYKNFTYSAFFFLPFYVCQMKCLFLLFPRLDLEFVLQTCEGDPKKEGVSLHEK